MGQPINYGPVPYLANKTATAPNRFASFIWTIQNSNMGYGPYLAVNSYRLAPWYFLPRTLSTWEITTPAPATVWGICPMMGNREFIGR
jgi:hypothetical protein